MSNQHEEPQSVAPAGPHQASAELVAATQIPPLEQEAMRALRQAAVSGALVLAARAEAAGPSGQDVDPGALGGHDIWDGSALTVLGPVESNRGGLPIPDDHPNTRVV